LLDPVLVVLRAGRDIRRGGLEEIVRTRRRHRRPRSLPGARTADDSAEDLTNPAPHTVHLPNARAAADRWWPATQRNVPNVRSRDPRQKGAAPARHPRRPEAARPAPRPAAHDGRKPPAQPPAPDGRKPPAQPSAPGSRQRVRTAHA